MLLRSLLSSLAVLLLFGLQTAGATGFTLGLSADPMAPQNPITPINGTVTASIGDTFTVVLGLDDVSQIFAYTIDFQMDSTELALTGATQLACADIGSGFCSASPFTLDPTDGGGRASRIGTDVLFIDSSRNFPPGTDGPAGMFSLTFNVLDVLTDGIPDVTIGFLDPRADAITGVDDMGNPVSIVPEPMMVSFSVVVPEPTTAALLGLGLVAMAARRRI